MSIKFNDHFDIISLKNCKMKNLHSEKVRKLYLELLDIKSFNLQIL